MMMCLSLLPHFFLVQTGTFVPLPFNQGLKVWNHVKYFQDTPPFLPVDYHGITPWNWPPHFSWVSSVCVYGKETVVLHSCKGLGYLWVLGIRQSFFVPRCQHSLNCEVAPSTQQSPTGSVTDWSQSLASPDVSLPLVKGVWSSCYSLFDAGGMMGGLFSSA